MQHPIIKTPRVGAHELLLGDYIELSKIYLTLLAAASRRGDGPGLDGRVRPLLLRSGACTNPAPAPARVPGSRGHLPPPPRRGGAARETDTDRVAWNRRVLGPVLLDSS